MPNAPRFETINPQHLVGISLEMSRIDDRTPELWRSFMPRRAAIVNRVSTSFMSMQIYPAGPAQIADPAATFTKWSAVQVSTTDAVPAGMHSYHLRGGLYAVFEHTGPASDLSTVLYIFQEWLPASNYELDNREHFELLPEGYVPTDPNAREEFWIPIKPA